MNWAAIAAAGVLLFGARDAVASCAGLEPYAFPAGGDVLPNPIIFSAMVVRAIDATGTELPLNHVPSGVKISAAEGVIFSLEAAPARDGAPNRFGPYRVIAANLSEVVAVEVTQVDRYSNGSPDATQAVVLTVSTAADAYQLEVQNLPDGVLRTLIVPARRAQYSGRPAELPAYLDIGSIDCITNFAFVTPKIQVRVAALRTDGKMSPYSAPIVIRAPLPTNASAFNRLLDLLASNPKPFAFGAAAFALILGFAVLRIRARAGAKA